MDAPFASGRALIYKLALDVFAKPLHIRGIKPEGMLWRIMRDGRMLEQDPEKWVPVFRKIMLTQLRAAGHPICQAMIEPAGL